MSLLRIHASGLSPLAPCPWSLVGDTAEIRRGISELAQLPGGTQRVALVLPTAQVFIARARLPASARRAASNVLAFALEEQLAGEPEANHVVWLGLDGDDDVLAVMDRQALQRWRDALAAVGIRQFEWHCDGLLIPWQPGDWSLTWNGREGVLRTARLLASCTDLGDSSQPPLALRLLLDQARLAGTQPDALVLYAETAEVCPDLARWRHALGIDIREGGPSDWRSAPIHAGVCLGQERQRWQAWTGIASRLRTAATIAGLALCLHGLALLADWRALANQQQALGQRMESRFRSTFPDAIAVVDPALQMQRKLAEARHAAGHAAQGDFLPMIEPVALALDSLPAGSLRRISFSQGQLILTVSTPSAEQLAAMLTRLRLAGMSIETSPSPAAGQEVMLTVRSS